MKKLMTILLISTIGFTSVNAMEDNGERPSKEGHKKMKAQWKSKSVDELKTHILEKLNQRSSELERAKSCVLQAEDKKALRECKPKKGKKGKRKNKESRD